MNLFESALEFNTVEGAKLKRVLEQRIMQLRNKLEQKQSVEETASLRGGIAELRALLAPAPQAQTPTAYSGMEARVKSAARQERAQ